MPRARSRRSSNAWAEACCRPSSICATAGACASAILRASPNRTPRAISCCCAVVQVPLQPAPLIVLCCDQTSSRCTQLLDEADVAENQSRLVGKVSDDPLVNLGQRFGRRHPNAEASEQLTRLHHGRG